MGACRPSWDPALLNTADVRECVAQARVARLATVDESGAPHVVPITFAVVGDQLFTAVDHKPKRTPELRRLHNIAHEARVAVLIDAYDDDWTKLWWCRLDGRARVIGEGPEFDRAVAALVARYEQYREVTPAGPVIAVDVTRWGGWSSS